MECISIFDMLKIGVGPSSSHTLGPWRAAERWINHLKKECTFNKVTSVKVNLYGSLSLTGKGHATDLAVILGLAGYDPETIQTGTIDHIITSIKASNKLLFGNEIEIDFNTEANIQFNNEFLPFHANGITFIAFENEKEISNDTYYSIGGGFVVREELIHAKENIEIHKSFPFPIQKAKELEEYCEMQNATISEIVYQNELSLRTSEEIDFEIKRIWNTMLECMYIGCHTEGILPGNLNVKRRAFDLHQKLINDNSYSNPEEWDCY